MNSPALRIAGLLTAAAIIIASALSAQAQRRITPVTPPKPGVTLRKSDTDKKPEVDRTRLEERLDAQGNVILVDTVTGTEFVDSTGIVPPVGNIYPLLHGVTVGVNVIEPLLRAFGQQYGGAEVWGELSLHNRYFPILEFGLSKADITPDGMNYTYRSPLAPYFKLGLNYNIFYNSNSAYQLLVGLRYGITHFKWTLTDITLSPDSYWGPSAPVSFPSQSSLAGFWEFALSLKVRIAGPISLGWAVKYHSMLHGAKSPIGPSLYIPGFGKRGNSLSVGFSVMYTIPLNSSPAPAVSKENTHTTQ